MSKKWKNSLNKIAKVSTHLKTFDADNNIPPYT